MEPQHFTDAPCPGPWFIGCHLPVTVLRIRGGEACVIILRQWETAFCSDMVHLPVVCSETEGLVFVPDENYERCPVVR
jgi:hypothetical protein